MKSMRKQLEEDYGNGRLYTELPPTQGANNAADKWKGTRAVTVQSYEGNKLVLFLAKIVKHNEKLKKGE